MGVQVLVQCFQACQSLANQVPDLGNAFIDRLIAGTNRRAAAAWSWLHDRRHKNKHSECIYSVAESSEHGEGSSKPRPWGEDCARRAAPSAESRDYVRPQTTGNWQLTAQRSPAAFDANRGCHLYRFSLNVQGNCAACTENSGILLLPQEG